MSTTHIWLRAETKPFERRTPLTPTGAGQLLAAGFKVTVEHSELRIFDIDQYRQLGCEIVAAESWQQAPAEAIILGLKELPESQQPLIHKHIYFAHAYKQQQGWQQLLARFKVGGGQLYDLEYLLDATGRRVAAFGYWAGFAGAALGIKAWANQQLGLTPALANVDAYTDKTTLIDDIALALAKTNQRPRVLVIGALGRSGRGAVDLATALGIEVVQWDLAETQAGGPFPQLLATDVLVNCVFVAQQLPPFLTTAMLADKQRKLSMIVDVSCDPYSSFNPLPIYHRCSDFQSPCIPLINQEEISQGQPLDLIAIDHLPSLLPKESSEDYAAQLMPHLQLLHNPLERVWADALNLFQQHSTSI